MRREDAVALLREDAVAVRAMLRPPHRDAVNEREALACVNNGSKLREPAEGGECACPVVRVINRLM